MRLSAHFPAALALGLLACALAGPDSALAQEEGQLVSIGTYYQCGQSRESRADEIFEEVWAPVMERHVSAGHLTGWGWLTHWVGGQWRRLGYFTASDLNVLLDTRDEIIEELGGDHAEALEEMSAICPGHDDYIWRLVAGGDATEPAAENAADFSTYYQCDMAREARADTLVTESLAPIFNRHLSADEFASWGWLQHWVGGKYRRLLAFRAADHKTAVNARDAIEEEMFEEVPGAAREFTQICNSHTDYMWNVRMTSASSQ